ncbi:hypothetical protein CCICO_00410 [Corynebacterium ciconiae DSM 44920]|uniref:hypothetical protein n=1 Tax=Corynebacterium ciconiae TaxID=227319 RepID=UPI00037E1F4B|nr:hypothetical protein [Corynebacterium ciconiae]WKD60145.1 hypothetical protein CCICO_00410 [Corynebacterium ciconiae DSM 44920]
MTGSHRAPSRLPRVSRRVVAAVSTAVIASAAAPLLATSAAAAPVPRTNPNGTISAPGRTQISFEHTLTGFHAGTANEHESRPGLSIVKMYIADYVFTHGTPEEKAQATQMLRTSDDRIASQLYAKYPQSINATASAYGLRDTHGAAHWGNSTTSTADSVKYLEAKKRQNPADPVLVALATASPVAADGYAQNFGTSTLPGVIGTKWGWSDDRRSFHASASYGHDFSVAAATHGPAAQLTHDVQSAFAPGGHIPAPPALPTPFGSAGIPMMNYPARQVVDQQVGHIAPPVTDPLVALVPEYVPMPQPVADFLPQPR